jgi:hypothetical protein
MTIKSGVLIPLLIMLPNVVWMLWPKADAGEHVSAPRVLTIVENIGRIAALILPLFFSLDGLALPMAVAPTVFLVLSSYLMSSWSMLSASILFGAAHIRVAAVSL